MLSNFCNELKYNVLNQMVQALEQPPGRSMDTTLIPALLDRAGCEKLRDHKTDIHSTGLNRFYWEFNSGKLLQRLAKLSSNEALIPDPKLRQAGLMAAHQALAKLQAIEPGYRHPETGLFWAASALLCTDYLTVIREQQHQLKPGDVLLLSSTPGQLSLSGPGDDSNTILIHYYALPV